MTASRWAAVPRPRAEALARSVGATWQVNNSAGTQQAAAATTKARRIGRSVRQAAARSRRQARRRERPWHGLHHDRPAQSRQHARAAAWHRAAGRRRRDPFPSPIYALRSLQNSMRYRLALTMFAVLGAVSAQSNTVPGLDARLTGIEDPRYFGRRGAAHPNGEIAIAYSYYVCNSGAVPIGWEGPFDGPQPMHTNHPMWSFMVVRESGGRIVQLTNDGTFVKHGSSPANSSGLCGNCQNPHNSAVLGVRCDDAYGQTTNANRYYLGPTDEIDPWLCTWDPVHSYFDRGDPE